MSVTRRAFLRQASAAGAALAAGCGGGDGGGDGAPSDALTDASADAAAGDATAWDTAAGDAGGAGARDAAPRDAGSDDLGPAEDAAGPDAEPAEPLPEYSWEGEPGPADLFADGVASGDPLPDSVILWTRLSTEDPGDVALFYEIARDPDFEHRVAAGWDLARADRDHTAKMDPRGLLPGTTWYFRFHAEGRTSPTGRTRTAPAGPTERLRLGVVSCSNITRGYFVAYKELAAMAGLDAVLHLGYYFYEPGGSGRVAHDPPHELLTLADYRTRYRQYRRDVDCQEMHRQHAFIPVWDDHETSNDAWFGGADSHNPATDGDWIQRKGWAIQAWHEYMPVRDASDRHIWRAFQFADLVDLIMLDTRLWGRDHQAQPGRGEDLFADQL